MASIKAKRFLAHDANGTDGQDLSKMSSLYECKIEDSQGDVVHYPCVRIAANTAEERIDAALIVAANPF